MPGLRAAIQERIHRPSAAAAWLVYNEPEGHLDKLAERLTHLDGVGAGSVIAGLTYKDDSTLARLNRLGFPSTFRLDPRADLGLDEPAAGLESVQAAVRI